MEWNEGADFIFDDSQLHYVINGRSQRRVVFTADVLRPNLPFPVWLLNAFLHRTVVPFLPDVVQYYAVFNQLYRRLSAQRREGRIDGDGQPLGECVFDILQTGDTHRCGDGDCSRTDEVRGRPGGGH